MISYPELIGAIAVLSVCAVVLKYFLETHFTKIPSISVIPHFLKFLSKSSAPVTFAEVCRLESKRRGPVIKFKESFWSSYNLIFVSNNFELMKEILGSSTWENRPRNKIIKERVLHRNIGFLANGPRWKASRTFTIKALSNLGFGKSSTMPEILSSELNFCIEHTTKTIEKYKNKIPVKHFFALPTINVVWRILGSQRFTEYDKGFKDLMRATETTTEIRLFDYLLLDLFYPIISLSFPLFGYGRFPEAVNCMHGHITDLVRMHQNDFNQEREPRDYIDHFLREIMKSKNNIEKDLPEHVDNPDPYIIDNLKMLLTDMFEGAVDTTSKTMEFGIMYLIQHPEVQQKIQNEIATVIQEKEPSYYDDKPRMPYTFAAILEISRMASVVSLNYRAATEDTLVNKHAIKKGTWAVVNLYSAHMDEDYWGDPFNFRPERFLDTDGSIISSKASHLLPFGGGKRMCIGETVANSTMFTLLVGFLQKFTIVNWDSSQELARDTSSALMAKPKPFFFTLKHNNSS